jgi:alkylation response protein AidB-like acyl-CoA dehydrogenase
MTQTVTGGTELVARAERVAEEVLFPGALATDAAPVVPVDRLDALGGAGLYGLFGPPEAGGLGADAVIGGLVTEVLAGACLTTAFVWAQHHGAVTTTARAPEQLREEWLGPLCRGDRRAGVAFAGLRRPGPPLLTARPSANGWVLRGSAPWVTGWGRVDVVHTAARDPEGNVVWLLVDAVASPTLEVEPLELAAVNASATVGVRFTDHEVPLSRLTLVEPFATWIARDSAGLSRNGSFPLGVARRCSRLLGSDGFDDEIAACRRALDESTPDTVAEARAGAADLAVRAASALVVSGGGRSVLVREQAQRLAREAMFLLVFGQTSSIKAAQLRRYRDHSAEIVRRLPD